MTEICFSKENMFLYKGIIYLRRPIIAFMLVDYGYYNWLRSTILYITDTDWESTNFILQYIIALAYDLWLKLLSHICCKSIIFLLNIYIYFQFHVLKITLVSSLSGTLCHIEDGKYALQFYNPSFRLVI